MQPTTSIERPTSEQPGLSAVEAEHRLVAVGAEELRKAFIRRKRA
ncbi:MAG TPA: hypothetical protein VI006_17320 [Solirubrobacteraceae bacterium]|jgi:hypothetical protein